MATHRTKTYEVEAWQYTKDLKKLPAWAKEKVSEDEEGKVVVVMPDSSEITIDLEWWVVKDQHGSIIAMPDAAFQNNYESVKPTSKKEV